MHKTKKVDQKMKWNSGSGEAVLVERNYVSSLGTVACHHQGMMSCLVGLFHWRTDQVGQQNWKLSAFYLFGFHSFLSLLS